MNAGRYSNGGYARSASMTGAERTRLATAAGRARWSARHAELEAKVPEVRALIRAGKLVRDIAAATGTYANFVMRVRDEMREDGEAPPRDRRGDYGTGTGEDTSPRCRCGLRIDASHTPETCDVSIYRYAGAGRGE